MRERVRANAVLELLVAGSLLVAGMWSGFASVRHGALTGSSLEGIRIGNTVPLDVMLALLVAGAVWCCADRKLARISTVTLAVAGLSALLALLGTFTGMSHGMRGTLGMYFPSYVTISLWVIAVFAALTGAAGLREPVADDVPAPAPTRKRSRPDADSRQEGTDEESRDTENLPEGENGTEDSLPEDNEEPQEEENSGETSGPDKKADPSVSSE